MAARCDICIVKIYFRSGHGKTKNSDLFDV